MGKPGSNKRARNYFQFLCTNTEMRMRQIAGGINTFIKEDTFVSIPFCLSTNDEAFTILGSCITDQCPLAFKIILQGVISKSFLALLKGLYRNYFSSGIQYRFCCEHTVLLIKNNVTGIHIQLFIFCLSLTMQVKHILFYIQHS